MFTLCPKCALTLVVTAADLRVAQGYVRCGRCLNVFNALARLSEERPGAPLDAPSGAAPDTAAPGSQPEQAASPEAAAQPTADDTGEIEVELDAASVLVTAVRAPAPPNEAGEPEAQTSSPGAAAERTAAPSSSEPASAMASVEIGRAHV